MNAFTIQETSELTFTASLYEGVHLGKGFCFPITENNEQHSSDSPKSYSKYPKDISKKQQFPRAYIADIQL